MPKRIGEKPLTKTEISARYRAKKRAAGFKEKSHWINPEEEPPKLEEYRAKNLLFKLLKKRINELESARGRAKKTAEKAAEAESLLFKLLKKSIIELEELGLGRNTKAGKPE